MFGAYLDGVITVVGINAITALGLYIAIATGQFSVGHGGFMAVGAYVSAILTVNFGWSLIPAIAVAAVAAFIVGGIISLPVMRFSLIYLAMATFGFGEIMRSILSTIDYIGGVGGMRGMSGTTLWMVMAFLAGLILLFWLHDRSRWGLACWAVRQDPDAAHAMGINVRSVKATAFAIGAAITGVGGALYAHHMLFIDPATFNFQMSITIILFVILGGMGIFWGPMLGAVILTVLPEIFHFIREWYLFVYGGVLIVMMIWRPQGIIDRQVINVVARSSRRIATLGRRAGREL